MRISFDKGTLVFETISNFHFDFLTLPGTLWDERTNQFRVPAFYYREIIARLDKHKISYENLIKPSTSETKTPIPTHDQQQDHNIFLRPYQDAALKSWFANDKRGIVILPTGSGKTKLAIKARFKCVYYKSKIDMKKIIEIVEPP